MTIRIKFPLTKGQSLIEILVSVALLSIVIGSVVAIMPGVLSTSALERDQTLAYQYARDGIEQIRHLRDSTSNGINTLQDGSYCLNSDGSMTSTVCTTNNIGVFKRELVVKQNAPECGGKISKVTVTVSWKSAKCNNGTYCNQSTIATCMNPSYNYLATYVTPIVTSVPTPTPTVGINTPTPTKPASTATPTPKPPTSTSTPTLTPTPAPVIKTITVNHDTFIWQQHPNTAYCNNGTVRVVNENAIDTRWGILSFNLQAFVPPAGKTLYRVELHANVTAGASNSPACAQHLHKWGNWGSSCPQWATDNQNSKENIAVIPAPAAGAVTWVMTPTDSFGGLGISYINNNIGTNLQYGIRTDQTTGCSNEVDYSSGTSYLTLYYH